METENPRWFIQGRVFANSPDEAAALVRDRWGEHGKLSLKCVEPRLRWYEFLVEIGRAGMPEVNIANEEDGR